LRRICCCATASSSCNSASLRSTASSRYGYETSASTSPILRSTAISGTLFATRHSAPTVPLSLNFILFDRALVCADVSPGDLQLNRKVDGVAESGELISLRDTQLSR
jgi:hypothetical protein